VKLSLIGLGFRIVSNVGLRRAGLDTQEQVRSCGVAITLEADVERLNGFVRDFGVGESDR
jgi:hypothetical protein